MPDEQNVTLTKPGDWTIHPFGCRQVYIANVTVRNPPTIGHCDGFDPDLSRDVLFEHNDIEVGDDGIAVKSGACNVDNASDYCGAHELEKLLGHGTEDVIIQHSWIRHRFTKIGSNCGGTIRNITFRNLKSGTGPSHNGGLFIGTHRGMGATISDITYEDIVIRGRVNHWQSMPSSPIRMAMFYHAVDLNATHGEYGVIANLTFRNIIAEAAPMAGCAWHDGKPPVHCNGEPYGPAEVGQFIGMPGYPMRGLTLDNVTVRAAPGTTLATWRCENVDLSTASVTNVVPPWTCK